MSSTVNVVCFCPAEIPTIFGMLKSAIYYPKRTDGEITQRLPRKKIVKIVTKINENHSSPEFPYKKLGQTLGSHCPGMDWVEVGKLLEGEVDELPDLTKATLGFHRDFNGFEGYIDRLRSYRMIGLGHGRLSGISR